VWLVGWSEQRGAGQDRDDQCRDATEDAGDGRVALRLLDEKVHAGQPGRSCAGRSERILAPAHHSGGQASRSLRPGRLDRHGSRRCGELGGGGWLLGGGWVQGCQLDGGS
jgi:hypothetical protein